MALLITHPSFPANETPADFVFQNANIITLEQDRSTAEAIAIRGDKIVAVGSSADIAPFINPQTQVIDLQGKTVVPGFIESHAHFLGVGSIKMQLDLRKFKSWNEIVGWVKAAAEKAKPGEWIVGRGWHQEKWNELPQPNIDRYPTHNSLSELTPEHPVMLTHASGHMSFANAKAMEIAGVNRDTPSPAGGEIVKDSAGNPIGIFRETAQGLVHSAYDSYRDKRTDQEKREEQLKQIELATHECLSHGVTSFQDAGSTFPEIDLYKNLAQEGKLNVRLWVMVNDGYSQLSQHLAGYKVIGLGDHHLTVRAIKKFIDGALGAHGAWLLEPYNDLPDHTGLNIEPLSDLKATAQLAYREGFQLCMHAIGDRANRETLDMFEEVLQGDTSRRWRIEHAQHLHPNDIPRFAQLGIIASIQACHAVSDAPFVVPRLGNDRAHQGAYAWRSLLDSGAIVCNGTDAPVEEIDPIANFHAAVTRQTNDGTYFFPEQKMTRQEALKSYTIDAAYAAFEEDIKGSLKPGKLADLTVLSQDILTISDDQIKDTKIVLTMVGGKIAYDPNL